MFFLGGFDDIFISCTIRNTISTFGYNRNVSSAFSKTKKPKKKSPTKTFYYYPDFKQPNNVVLHLIKY